MSRKERLGPKTSRLRTAPETTRGPTIPTDVQIVEKFIAMGVKTYVEVPCSITDTLHQLWDQKHQAGEIKLVTTNNEHDLPGIAAGIHAGTKETVLIHMQNSGLPNAADGIISFAEADVFKIPMVALVTLRGNSPKDDSEPHQAIGKRTPRLSKSIMGDNSKIYGTPSGRRILKSIEKAVQKAQQGEMTMILLPAEAFRKVTELKLPEEVVVYDQRAHMRMLEEYKKTTAIKGTSSRENPLPSNTRLTREEAMKEIVAAHSDAAILFCNGYNARAAQGSVDREGNFYNVGYMGGTLAMGWGLATSNPDIQVVVVDGDQNASMSTFKDHLAHQYPENLFWYVLDNKTGVSVGVAKSIPLPPWTYELARVVQTIPEEPGTFVYPRVKQKGAVAKHMQAGAQAMSGFLAEHYANWSTWIYQQTRRNIRQRALEFAH